MPRSLVFSYEKEELACPLVKVDRSKLYGYVTNEVVDEEGEPCELATLASDGQTLIGSGGTTFAYFDPDGNWCQKDQLTPVNLENEKLVSHPSSFNAPIVLDHKVSIEEYLSCNIRLIYALEPEEDKAFPDQLLKELKAGAIFGFPFSYREGLDPDDAFLIIGQDKETVWLTVGKQTEIRFVALQERAPVVEDEGVDGDGDSGEIDFDLF